MKSRGFQANMTSMMYLQIMKTNSTIKYGIIHYYKLEESTVRDGWHLITSHSHYFIYTKRDSAHFLHSERVSQIVKLSQWWRGFLGIKEIKILNDFLGRASMIADNMRMRLICSPIRTSSCTQSFARAISNLKVTKPNQKINHQEELIHHRWIMNKNRCNYQKIIVVFLVNLK